MKQHKKFILIKALLLSIITFNSTLNAEDVILEYTKVHQYTFNFDNEYKKCEEMPYVTKQPCLEKLLDTTRNVITMKLKLLLKKDSETGRAIDENWIKNSNSSFSNYEATQCEIPNYLYMQRGYGDCTIQLHKERLAYILKLTHGH